MDPSLPWPCLQHYHEALSASGHALSPTEPTSPDTFPGMYSPVCTTLQVALLAIQTKETYTGWQAAS